MARNSIGSPLERYNMLFFCRTGLYNSEGNRGASGADPQFLKEG